MKKENMIWWERIELIVWGAVALFVFFLLGWGASQGMAAMRFINSLNTHTEHYERGMKQTVDFRDVRSIKHIVSSVEYYEEEK